MSTKVLLALFACSLTACQVGHNTPGFNKDPNATNPDTVGANQQPVGTQPGDGNQPATDNNQPTTPVTPAGQSVASPRFIGRVDPSTKLMTWGGTAVEAGFTGSGGTATFTTQNSISSYIGVSVDGGPITKVTVSNTTAVPFAASGSGNHIVRLYKLNEADLGSVTFNAITITGGSLINITPSGRRIEFIGDSITVGYGIDGNSPCSNNGSLENASKAYSWVAARALKADASLVAISGHGMLRNAVGVTDTVLMPIYYQQAIAHGPAGGYKFPAQNAPQAIVIMLGTNDYSYLSYATGSPVASRPLLDQNNFVQAYQAFVTNVRANNPDALIVLASSPMLSDTYPPNSDEEQGSSLLSNLNTVQSALGDAKIVVLNVPTQNTNLPTGCESHPSPTEAQKMADQLTALLGDKLGWTD